MVLRSYSILFCVCVFMMAESVVWYPDMRRFSANPPSMSVKLKTEPYTSILSDNYYMMPSNHQNSKDRQYFSMQEQRIINEPRNKDDIKRMSVAGTNAQQKPK
ncbi:uncharacterized protein LOC134709526 [Mytilus trossulus]|uniref:uncharacterized protein LOC134709526 n=1 Tax=Mytilus trossulus TaxID=6551 RepID=UPI003003ECA8